MFLKHLVFVISVLSLVHSAPSCGENEVYTNCMAPCKLQQCKYLKQMPDCDPNIKCQPGCECIQNFLRNSDNVCISSDICEEYDSEFDPENDIDVIENDDDEATNEDQVFDNTVSSQDGLTKEIEPGSKMISNTEEVKNTDHDTEDDDQNINGIDDYLSFEEQLKNGDWVIEQPEHNDANQEPNTDQKKLNNEESEIDAEKSTEKQTDQAPENEVEPKIATTITPNIKQSKISGTELNKFSYKVIDVLSDTEKKLKPKEIESNRTIPSQINIEDKIGNSKFNQTVDETLETSTVPEKDELPIKIPITEVYPEDNRDTNQRRELPRPGHDSQPNKTRPEQNTDESRESTNITENNENPNRRPGTEVYPEDNKDLNQWREPPRPQHDDQSNNTRPEQNTDESRESTNIPENNEKPNRRPGTEVYPEDRENTNQWRDGWPPRPRYDDQPNKTRPEQNTDESQESTNYEKPNRRPGTEEHPEYREDTNQWPEPPRPWHGEQPYTTSRPEQSTKPWYPYIPPRKWHGSKHHKRPISRNNPVTIIYPYPIFIEKPNERHAYPDSRPYEHGYERGYERNREHGYDREGEHGHERNRQPEWRRKNEYERNREPERRRENEYERNREPKRRRENEYERNREPERRRENKYERNREPERRRENEYERYREPERRRENEYERNREPERRRENEYERNRKNGYDSERRNERNREHGYGREHGHEHERSHEHEYGRDRSHEHERNRQPEHRRENEHDHNPEPERRRNHEHDRNSEPERRREHDYGHNGPNHRRPRAWCRRNPRDKRRPCPRYNNYRPKHDSHGDYKNNNNHYGSNKRPTRVCTSQRHGERICYVRKDWRRN